LQLQYAIFALNNKIT